MIAPFPVNVQVFSSNPACGGNCEATCPSPTSAIAMLGDFPCGHICPGSLEGVKAGDCEHWHNYTQAWT
jgi:hypothetical protein